MAELEGGTITLPKRISLALGAVLAAQLVYLVYDYATSRAVALADIERLKRDVAIVGQINDRTIRMETELGFIKAAVERLAKR